MHLRTQGHGTESLLLVVDGGMKVFAAERRMFEWKSNASIVEGKRSLDGITVKAMESENDDQSARSYRKPECDTAVRLGAWLNTMMG